MLPTHTVIYRDGISEGPICKLCNVEEQTLHRLLINCTLTLDSTRGYVLNFQNSLLLIHGKLEILKEIVTAKKARPKILSHVGCCTLILYAADVLLLLLLLLLL